MRKLTANIFVDSGSIFFKPNIQEKSSEIALENSIAIIECYNYMNYDAIGITTHDLQFGSHFLKKIEKKATFPFLSNTVVNRNNNTPIFTPHTIISKNNLKIGLIGITSQIQVKSNKKYKIIDWKEPLATSLKQLKDVDLIIVFSNLSHKMNLYIAQNYPPVNIILEAGQRVNAQQTTLEYNTLICHTPKDGKYIGELQIDWQESKIWKTDDKPILQLKNDIDRLKWFQNRILKRGGPEKAYKNMPSALIQYKQKMQQLTDLEQKLNKIKDTETKNIITSTYQSTLHPLKPSIHDELQTTRILKNSRKKANTLRRKTDVLKRFDVYTGSISCKKCHKKIYQAYKKTRHSKAYATLVRKSNNNNPNCIFCHVTGLPERLAYIQAQVPKRLLEVGCEVCHGQGSQHIRKPKTYKMIKKVPDTTCLTCHTDEHSSDFNYERDVEFVH